MKRNITITLDNSNTQTDHVCINDLSSIVNYSCDSIILFILEYLQEKDHAIVMKTLLEKLRPNGKLIIAANNAKYIAKQFIDSSISHDAFLKFFANKQSLVSVESLYTMVDFQYFDIVDLDINTNTIKIILERKPL
jgi:predicted SAM-dependent methyltransferase